MITGLFMLPIAKQPDEVVIYVGPPEKKEKIKDPVRPKRMPIKKPTPPSQATVKPIVSNNYRR